MRVSLARTCGEAQTVYAYLSIYSSYMYRKVNLDDVDEREIDDIEPRLRSVGYELRPQQMRPSVWTFEEGDSNNRHRQREQEELYYVVDGTAVMDVDGEEFDVETGDFVVVSPDSWRQITATSPCTILAIGAPNVKDDTIREDEA